MAVKVSRPRKSVNQMIAENRVSVNAALDRKKDKASDARVDVREWEYLVSMDDWSGALQAAANEGVPLSLHQGEFIITQPIKFGSYFDIEGCAAWATRITKIGSEVSSGSNTAPERSGAVTDSYAKNAIFIGTHADLTYNVRSRISSIGLSGTNEDTEYGIYIPRSNRLRIENVYIDRGRVGFETNSSWLATIHNVVVNGYTKDGYPGDPSPESYGHVGVVSRGFHWANDGSGGGTGTTANVTSCWARNVHVGYETYGLSYSSFSNCASEDTSKSGYVFTESRVTLNGCGAESNYLGAANGAVLRVSGGNSKIIANGFNTATTYGGSTGTTALVWCDTGVLIMNACRLENFISAGTSFNMVVQNGAEVTMNYTPLPSGGNSYIGYGGGAVLTESGSTGIRRRTSSGIVFDTYGTGSPESVVSAGIGSTYRRLDGGADTSFYIKESGTGNTGWVAK